MQVYPSDYGVSLDFQQIVNFIKSKTTHERIIDLLEGIYPIDDFDEIKLRLLETEELANLLKQGGFPNFSFIDLTKPLQLLNKEGAVLLEEQVLSVRRSSVIVNELLDFFEQNPGYENLGRNFHMVYFTNTIVKEIDKIIDIHGLVKTSASKELEKIRKKLYEKRQESDRRFQSAVAKLKNQNMLRDFEETVYKSRRVLAVPAEYKRTVKGMILSHSANQLTAYIEPQGNLKLNLEIDELVEEERREIFKILRVLSHFLRQHLELIKAYDDVLVTMEALRAKARFTVDIDGLAPPIQNVPEVELIEAYHPILLVNYKKAGKKVVPLNLSLNKDNKVVVISGPNAGGKSVSLKTLGLIQIMVQCGLPVPVKEGSTIGIFKNIFVDVGDTQSIDNELSTYSSKLTRLKYFVEKCDENTLFLIDEFGTGSDPDLGGALAESILENLAKTNAKGLVTTHYANIKRFAEETDGIANANMLFDVEKLSPKFELVIGMPGSSYTFEVAQNTGLPRHIINNAKRKVNSHQVGFDKLLSTYSQKLKSVEEELKFIKQQKVDLKQIESEANTVKDEFEQRLKLDKQKAAERARTIQYGKFLEDLLFQYDKNKNKKILTDKLLKKYQAEKVKQLENKKSALVKPKRAKSGRKPKFDPKLFKVGDEVRLKNSHQKGKISSIEKEKAEVNMGFIKTIVSINDLRPVETIPTLQSSKAKRNSGK